jgi:hypothetical protein
MDNDMILMPPPLPLPVPTSNLDLMVDENEPKQKPQLPHSFRLVIIHILSVLDRISLY